ncbi:MAG: trypsin-like serine peptidase, partial [Planctomycetaceae bacterium]
RSQARTRNLDRLRWRLQQLGLPAEALPSLDAGGVSFRPVAGDDEGPAPAADLLLERILGRNDMVAAPRFLEAGLRASRAVARLRMQSASGKLLGWGTGSLVAPRLLLTNNHVLPSAEQARTSLAEFNVEEPLPGQATPSVPFVLRPDEFFLTDVRLDFTLVAVAPQSTTGRSLAEFGFNPPHAGDDPILESEKVNIIQHPAG